MRDISTVLNFEGHSLTFLQTEAGVRLLRATDLAAPMEVKKPAISMAVKQLADEDRCSIELNTPGGRQAVQFLTPSGALQVLAGGRSEKCRRLRKVVCDFYVANQGQAGEISELRKMVAELAAEIARLKSPAMRPLQHGLKRYGAEDLHLLTPGEEVRLWRDGFSTASAFLQQVTGEKPRGPVAGGLTNRAVRWSKRTGSEVRRYLKSGQVLTFLPREVFAELYDGSREAGQLLLTAPEANRKEV